jgi:ribosomal protein L12E/L44/L45/RPP1/RPP2
LTQNSKDLEEAVLKLMRESMGIVAPTAADEKLRKRREKYKEGQGSKEEESDVEMEFDE